MKELEKNERRERITGLSSARTEINYNKQGLIQIAWLFSS